ncbi:MAG: hypothetical protein DRP13_00710 [Candidatus Aenigmatarchaeota archaeon]|nr:MAG: hypothetical protein DRP13_00710 [Candidatus Aenigmarchaeota archaeon]
MKRKIIIYILFFIILLILLGESFIIFFKTNNYVCGNGVCEKNENIYNCEVDCKLFHTLDKSNFYFLGYSYLNQHHHHTDCLTGNTLDIIQLYFRVINISSDYWIICDIYDNQRLVRQNETMGFVANYPKNVRGFSIGGQDFTKKHNYNICCKIDSKKVKSNEICFSVDIDKEEC